MGTDRRLLTDRRARPTKPLTRHSVWGRRKSCRRERESSNYYVDRYESRYFVLISLILGLCVLDAYFTLKIIDFGGQELNRFMLSFIYREPALALVFKYLITALSIVFIVVHKNFRVFGRCKAQEFIYFIFFVYSALVAYEAVVFFKHIRALGP